MSDVMMNHVTTDLQMNEVSRVSGKYTFMKSPTVFRRNINRYVEITVE